MIVIKGGVTIMDTLCWSEACSDWEEGASISWKGEGKPAVCGEVVVADEGWVGAQQLLLEETVKEGKGVEVELVAGVEGAWPEENNSK